MSKREIKVACLIVFVVIGFMYLGSPFSLRFGEPPDISGNYIFKKENCAPGPSGCFFGANPLFSISYLSYEPGPVRVSVSKTEDGYLIEHRISSTTAHNDQGEDMRMFMSRANLGLGWDSKKVVYRWARWGAEMGVGRQSRTVKFYLNKDRSLTIKSRFTEGGLAFFFLPFVESFSSEMRLVPV